MDRTVVELSYHQGKLVAVYMHFGDPKRVVGQSLEAGNGVVVDLDQLDRLFGIEIYGLPANLKPILASGAWRKNASENQPTARPCIHAGAGSSSQGSAAEI